MDGEYEIKQAYASILDSDFEQALDWFEQAVQQDPDNAFYHHKLSITYARSNRIDRAFEHARRAVELEPDNETYRQYGETLQARSLMQEAEKLLKEETDPRPVIPMLKRAVELDPIAVEAYVLLAVAYERLDEYGLALQAANDAFKLDPHRPEAGELADRLRAKNESR